MELEYRIFRFLRIGCACVLLAPLGVSASREPVIAAPNRNTLAAFSESVQELAAKVAPAVVHIVVDSYGRPAKPSDRTADDAGGRAIGSGVIIDPSGYIVTNAHVVENARRIRVTLTPPASDDDDAASVGAALEVAYAKPKMATLVGMYKEGDLALIKIDAEGLPTLPFADYRNVRQGQVVFAFGSREGLHNSVSMGVVSSVARQLEPDSPFIYVQTDAAINPGDSGGPLVNAAGEIVGIDTMILTQSGGSEGLGFAIPSPLVELAAQQLRAQGHFHRRVIGVGAQSVTPLLASSLKLPKSSGVIVTEVLPESPATAAGLHVNDIVLAVDGRSVRNLPLFMLAMMTPRAGRPLSLRVLRGAESFDVSIMPVQEAHAADRLADLIDAEKNELPHLGAIGIAIDQANKPAFPGVESPSGVYVAAWSRSSADRAEGLQIGDVIHGINGKAVETVPELKTALGETTRGDAMALWIEREGKMKYLAFERQ